MNEYLDPYAQQEANKRLYDAIRNCDYDNCKEALEQGASANMFIMEMERESLLEMVVINEQPDIAKLLLEHGAVIEEVHLRRAVQNCDFETTAHLLDYGADINNEPSILHVACNMPMDGEDRKNMIGLLIERGADETINSNHFKYDTQELVEHMHKCVGEREAKKLREQIATELENQLGAREIEGEVVDGYMEAPTFKRRRKM